MTQRVLSRFLTHLVCRLIYPPLPLNSSEDEDFGASGADDDEEEEDEDAGSDAGSWDSKTRPRQALRGVVKHRPGRSRGRGRKRLRRRRRRSSDEEEEESEEEMGETARLILLQTELCVFSGIKKLDSRLNKY